MTTDTSEKGLETLIMRHMTGTDGLAVARNRVTRPPTPYGGTGGTGYTAGSAQDYDRAYALDVASPRLTREIDLLREYRTRLVADVVTGKLDVREVAAWLPDESPLGDFPSSREPDSASDLADEIDSEAEDFEA